MNEGKRITPPDGGIYVIATDLTDYRLDDIIVHNNIPYMVDHENGTYRIDGRRRNRYIAYPIPDGTPTKVYSRIRNVKHFIQTSRGDWHE